MGFGVIKMRGKRWDVRDSWGFLDFWREQRG